MLVSETEGVVLIGTHCVQEHTLEERESEVTSDLMKVTTVSGTFVLQ